jgi:hypothetical protein
MRYAFVLHEVRDSLRRGVLGNLRFAELIVPHFPKNSKEIFLDVESV